MHTQFTADDARRWALLTRAAFAARRAEIDALNVYPVPDGDTGTNLYLTLDGALDQVIEIHTRLGTLGTASLVAECTALSRAVLLSARGNSGVILSQIIRGIAQVVIEGDHEAIDASTLARCLERGADLARRAVARPQAGTMLTIADAAAGAAATAAAAGQSLPEVADALVRAATEALRHTPEQLPALAAAGVVDAGGAGCVLMLEALRRVLTGDWSADADGLLGGGSGRREEWHRGDLVVPAGLYVADLPGTVAETTTGGPAYEVMFLLEESGEEEVTALTTTLDRLGDSLVVSGGPDVWNVHVHVDDVGAAIEAGIDAGRPRRIQVTNLALQVDRRRAHQAVGVVACAAGPGIGAILADAGAVVVPSAPGGRASAGQLLDAARATGAHAVLVLPNDKDTLLAAQATVTAAAHLGIGAHVIPTRTAVQGLAAMAVHDPSASVQDNIVAMTGAARATRHGAVTVATKEALTMGGHCVPGDVLGVVDGDIVIVGSDLTQVAAEVLRRLLGAGGELVTLILGADAPPHLADALGAGLRREAQGVEVSVLDGGQAAYPLLIGVE